MKASRNRLPKELLVSAPFSVHIAMPSCLSRNKNKWERKESKVSEISLSLIIASCYDTRGALNSQLTL